MNRWKPEKCDLEKLLDSVSYDNDKKKEITDDIPLPARIAENELKSIYQCQKYH